MTPLLKKPLTVISSSERGGASWGRLCPCWNVTGLDLVLCLQDCSRPVIPGWQCRRALLPPSSSYSLPTLSYEVSLGLGGEDIVLFLITAELGVATFSVASLLLVDTILGWSHTVHGAA